jgi:protoporphyrinogen oxidase
MRKKPCKTGNNPEIILCKKSKRFENLIVCTLQCFDRCEQYKKQFDIELIKNYINNHPDYEMKGVIMPTSKKVATKPTTVVSAPVVKQKLYWIITDENQFVEVTEEEIINNPAEYIGKDMFEKPKDQYEIVVTIKKKTGK